MHLLQRSIAYDIPDIQHFYGFLNELMLKRAIDFISLLDVKQNMASVTHNLK